MFRPHQSSYSSRRTASAVSDLVYHSFLAGAHSLYVLPQYNAERHCGVGYPYVLEKALARRGLRMSTGGQTDRRSRTPFLSLAVSLPPFPSSLPPFLQSILFCSSCQDEMSPLEEEGQEGKKAVSGPLRPEGARNRNRLRQQLRAAADGHEEEEKERAHTQPNRFAPILQPANYIDRLYAHSSRVGEKAAFAWEAACDQR